MLTILSGTNRSGSKTRIVAQNALNIAQELNIDTQLIDLSTLSSDFIHNSQYNPDALPDWFKEMQEKALIPASHFLIISPEYNGSIPGYLKLFIDAISVHRLDECFSGKHSALVGVASGRAGNLRGIDHLTTVMHHIGCSVLPNSLPISSIDSVMDQNSILNEDTTNALRTLIQTLIAS